MRIRNLIVAFVLGGAIAAGLGVALSLRDAPAVPNVATIVPAGDALPEFSLLDHGSETVGRSLFEGQWDLVFFGFTNCPDVCPAALFTLDQVLERIGPAGDGSTPRVVMISVDPARDTPQKLSTYVPYFDPDFLGVTGDMPEIKRLTDAIGVAFAYTPTPGSGDGYTVDHTASIFLFDPDGRLSAIFSTPHDAGTIASDFRRIAGGRS